MAIADFQNVAQAAEQLVAEGKKPSIRTVIDVLGGGSPNAVLRALQEWRAGRRVERPHDAEIDQDIKTAIARQMTRVAAEAAHQAEERAATAEADAKELASNVAQLEAALLSMTVERDSGLATVVQLQARVAEAEAEAVRQVERERATRQALDAALLEQGRAEIRLEAVGTMHQEIASLRTMMADCEQRRVIAEKESAVAQAVLATLKEQIADQAPVKRRTSAPG